ncbi:MAG: M57 family metalloprotease [Psychroflexus sp.]
MIKSSESYDSTSFMLICFNNNQDGMFNSNNLTALKLYSFTSEKLKDLHK